MDFIQNTIKDDWKRKMKKIVIIINGNGGVGKDTLCDFASEKYKVTNVSAITPIKEIALKYGWKGEKDAKARKFLADLKRTFVEYNDLPTTYLVNELDKFKKSDSDIMFAHIREAEEIDKFRKKIDIPNISLLIKRNMGISNWGNKSDDNVEEYTYDYVYINEKSLEDAKGDFNKFLGNILKKHGIAGEKSEKENSNHLLSINRLANTISNWCIQDKKLLQKKI